MEQQSSVAARFNGLNFVQYGALILPSKEYTTSIVNFPGNNCIPEWGTRGNFIASFNAWVDGKELGSVHTPQINESGSLEFDLDDIISSANQTKPGLVLIQYWHAATIPVEIYASHVHRKTGAYVAYPGLMYIGDKIYVNVHSEQLENSLFWPGVMIDEKTTLSLAILNPYKSSFGYQISLFLPDGSRIQTGVDRLKPLSSKILAVEELFPNHIQQIIDARGTASICITAQYKLLAYGIVTNRASGIITTLDHLHLYTMV